MFMSHPNILKMYGFFREGTEMVMVLEYAPDKCLFSQLHQPLPEEKAAYYAKQVL